MLDRRVFLILVLAVLCGCGGGGGGGSAPSASVTPSASPDPEAAADPAAAVAERRDAIRAEVRAYRALKPRQVQLLYWKLDGLALTLGSRHFRADTRRLARLTREMTAPDGTLIRGYAALAQRTQRQEWATLVPAWKRQAARLARLKLRGALARSARDFQLAEWRRSIAVMREFLGYLRRESPASTHDGYYQARSYGQATRWPVVIAVPGNKRKVFLRGLRRDLSRLQGTEALGPRSPSVGDVYRRAIVRSFVSPLRKSKQREAIVASQQWMLFRLAELEGTPRDVYEAARSTIALQGLSDARNPYASLRDVGLELISHHISDERDLRQARRLRTWASKLLARPVPPLLEPTRARMIALFDGLDLASPPADDPFAIFDLSDAYDRDKKPMERILRRGAKLVDSPRKLREATVAAVLATRPEV
jgi:hypothetical protein